MNRIDTGLYEAGALEGWPALVSSIYFFHFHADCGRALYEQLSEHLPYGYHGKLKDTIWYSARPGAFFLKIGST